MAEGKQPQTGAENRPYRCYLVRCWLEESAGASGESLWRFSVRQAGTGVARRAFNSLQEVTSFIETELASCERSGR
jgi:hypothetical protein